MSIKDVGLLRPDASSDALTMGTGTQIVFFCHFLYDWHAEGSGEHAGTERLYVHGKKKQRQRKKDLVARTSLLATGHKHIFVYLRWSSSVTVFPVPLIFTSFL